MLIFNEGKPRAGKSYDAVLTHILPALKRERRVFARLNGLKFDGIAEHLGLPVERVQELLTIVSVEEVAQIHEIAEPDSLVVIDECHKFYPRTVRPLPPHVIDFFAEHGQSGIDVVLISQSFKALHTAICVRVERKNFFQKLTAVGQKDSYLVKYYHSTSADKFEEVGKAKKKYDPAMFPLYDGYKPGTENTEVYEEGGITVWKTVMPYFIAAACLLLVGGFFYVRFFVGHSKKPAPVVHKPAASMAKVLPAVVNLPHPPESAKPAKPAKSKRPDMPPEPAYIWSLTDQARPRLAGYAGLRNGRFFGVVEWRADQSRVVDSLTVDQIRALGVNVVRTRYGLRLEWGEGKAKQTIIVTAWPLDQPDRYSRQDIDNIRAVGPVLSETVPSAGDARPVAASAPHPRATATAYVPPTMGAWNPDPFGSK